jgi:hypothetical protein
MNLVGTIIQYGTDIVHGSRQWHATTMMTQIEDVLVRVEHPTPFTR